MKHASPFKIGVVGVGRIGLPHAEACANTRGLKLESLCDTDAAVVRKMAGCYGCEPYTSFEEMLCKSDADMIVIATPSHLHADMTINALKSGFHIMVEKPIAQSASEAQKMIKAAQSAGKYLMVNQSLRYQKDVKVLRDILSQGIIGDIYNIYRAARSFSERKDWQIWRKYNGGAVSNLGVHFVDCLLFMLDKEPKNVFAQFHQILDKGDAEDSFNIVVKFDNGCVGCCEALKAQQGKAMWYICGTKGSILIEDTQPVVKMRIKAIGKRDTVRVIDLYKAESPLVSHYKDLAKKLRNGEEPPILAESVIKQMKVIDAAKKSNLLGRSISIR